MYNNLIYVNGDSFSEGCYYSNRTECWPWRLNIHGVDVLNDAMGGSSNHRIMRTTFHTVTRMTDRISITILQWTDPCRWERPGNDNYVRQFRNTESDTVVFGNWIDQIATMEHFFNCMNIPVFFFCAYTALDQFSISDDVDRQRIQKKMSMIDRTKWIWPYSTSLINWSNDNNLQFRDDGHLQSHENIKVAEFIRKFLLERT